MSSSNTAKIAEIQKSFRDIVKDPKSLDEAANYLYMELLDDAVLGVFLEIHHLYKSGNLVALDGVPEKSEESYRIVELANFDIFGISTAKKTMDCICPNCDRPVNAGRFAPHLEKCMGMGRISSRIASRRLATKEGNSSSSTNTNAAASDDEDEDWSEKRRKKTSQSSRNNGSKKNNGKTF